MSPLSIYKCECGGELGLAPFYRIARVLFRCMSCGTIHLYLSK